MSRKSGICMGCGAFCVVSGAIMAVFWPTIFFGQLKNMMILTNESMSYDVWRETPIPMFLDCYMFNITNVDEILAGNGTVKPRLVQMGPYVYRELHRKVNITWNDNNTVTFFNERFWHFQPHLSNGSLSDKVTSINPVIMTVAYMLRYRPILAVLANAFMSVVHEHVFVTANVSTWLFDGLEDPLMNIGAHVPGVHIPYEKFGWFFERNGSLTYDGIFVMNTGAKDFSQLGNVEMWQHSNQTVYRDHCGTVRGSTGELWAPELGQPEVLIFAPDICTYMALAKDTDHRVQGIDGVRYAANKSIFDNGHNYKERACYCEEEHPDQCMPSGALNVSLCRYGAPAFVSLPHFYNADPIYLTQVDGLEPTPEHNLFLTLEMFTGIPLAVSAQLQISIHYVQVPGFSILHKIPSNTMVPMFWFRQELQITDEFAGMARFALNLRYGVMYAMYALTGLGVLLLMAGITVMVRRLMVTSETVPILDEASQRDSD